MTKKKGTSSEKTAVQVRKKSQIVSICHRFSKNKMAMLGLALFLIVIFFAAFADVFAEMGICWEQTLTVETSLPALFSEPDYL